MPIDNEKLPYNYGGSVITPPIPPPTPPPSESKPASEWIKDWGPPIGKPASEWNEGWDITELPSEPSGDGEAVLSSSEESAPTGRIPPTIDSRRSITPSTLGRTNRSPVNFLSRLIGGVVPEGAAYTSRGFGSNIFGGLGGAGSVAGGDNSWVRQLEETLRRRR